MSENDGVKINKQQMRSPNDLRFMRRALHLAARGAGHVSPNPMVGCVITRGGRVVAEGWHKRFGSDHAEIVALKALVRWVRKGRGGMVERTAGLARGATIYVTLEPCAHFGKTPPCVQAVIAARPERVVIALRDPNPLTAGKSIRRLKRAGIRTEVGIGGPEAADLNRHFIKFIKHRTPYVIAKVAQSMDGMITARRGKQFWLTGRPAQRYVQNLRAQVDAVMVGRNTVAIDNPRLNVRNRRKPQPRRIILDSRLRTKPASRLFKTPGGEIILVCALSASNPRVNKFRRRGVNVLCLPSRTRRIALASAFKALGRRGISSVLCEGGAEVFSALRRARLVDEWHLIVAPRRIGAAGVPAFTGALPALGRLREAYALGRDLLLRFASAGRPGKR